MVQLRLATLEKNREGEVRGKAKEQKKDERASIEELEWIECERSNQVKLGSSKRR